MTLVGSPTMPLYMLPDDLPVFPDPRRADADGCSRSAAGSSRRGCCWPTRAASSRGTQKAYMSLFDQWILTKLGVLEKNMEDALEQERFSDAATSLYQFIWNEFRDWYIEFSKPILTSDRQNERKATQLVMAQVMNRFIRLLHPFCPFITEEMYQKLPIRNAACITDAYPTVRSDRALLEFGSESVSQEVDFIKDIISAIRNIRGENRISPAEKLKIRIGIADGRAQKIVGENKNIIETLARVEVTFCLSLLFLLLLYLF